MCGELRMGDWQLDGIFGRSLFGALGVSIHGFRRGAKRTLEFEVRAAPRD